MTTKSGVKKKSVKKVAKDKPEKSSSAASASKAVKKKAVRRTTRQTEALQTLSRDELEQHFNESSTAEILELFDRSYVSDMVNLLFTLKKSSVRQLFANLASVRKRSVSEAVTLYYYKDYLLNPFPLEVGNNRLPNSYAILGVPREVDQEDLKLAHKLLNKAHQPDLFSPSMRDTGGERLAEINDAFQQLNTPERRQHTNTVLPSMQYLYPKPQQSWLGSVQRILS